MGAEVDQASEDKKKKRMILIILLIVLVIVAVVLVVALRSRDSAPAEADNGKPKLGYAEGLVAADDADSLQAMVDEMYAKAAEQGIALEFINDAYSKDGQTFDCYFANSLYNKYDMFITIYADDALQDELFLSGLCPPGKAFETFTLNHSLPVGNHQVILFITQVEDDHETLHAQASITMDFHVTES